MHIPLQANKPLYFYLNAHPEACLKPLQPFMPRLLTPIDEKHQIKTIRDGISIKSQEKYACERFPCFDVLDGGVNGKDFPLC